MALILKNTFYDIAEPEEKVHARRSSSAPPSWKPLGNSCDDSTWGNGKNLQSDASTTVSDDECSDTTPASLGNSDSHDADVFFPQSHSTMNEAESPTCDTQPLAVGRVESWFEASDASTAENAAMICLDAMIVESESTASDVQEAPQGKFTLCLDDTITSTLTPGGPRTKLSSKARAFAPVAPVDDEILTLIESAREVLQSSPDALSVKVSQGAMGGTTTVFAEVRSSSLQAATMQQTMTWLKSTLLEIAAGSEHTYILGYGAQPFQDTSCGFTFVCGCVHSLQEHSVCWDTWEQGFCKRPQCCRWCHPAPADLMQIDVMLRETA